MRLRKEFRIKFGIILVLLVVFFLVFNLTGFSKEVKNFFYLISSPIQKVFWKIGKRVSDFFETIKEIKTLKRENEELKLKIQELLAENVNLRELRKENEVLRDALKIGLEKDFKLILVEIIGKDISQDSISINKGFKDGISKDMPVITQEKVLVGRIGEIYKNFSKVFLISNQKISFDAKIIDKEILGVIKGKGNSKVFFEFIPKDKEIKEGDLVVTSGLSEIFPSGLIVGQISQVQKSDLEPFQTAKIQPHFNIEDLEKLFIIER